MMKQGLSLAKKPHIVIATPGRLADHLANTDTVSLKRIKFLVSACEVPTSQKWVFFFSDSGLSSKLTLIVHNLCWERPISIPKDAL